MKTAFKVTRDSRQLLLLFLEKYSLAQLNKIPEGFNNNIIWNIGHIIVIQQRIAYTLSGLPIMISDEMANMYMKDTKPERDVTAEEVEEMKTLLFTTLDKTEEDFKNGLFVNYKEHTTSMGFTLTNITNAVQFNNYHEGLHLGVIMSLRKLV
ncbi:DinB family protein [Flavobacterium arcticum]|uniref:DinB family protein n=1 Tax=Flavobacterium arcticum TaxID=1784713 RepID=A0A345HBF4_9FLAO|nr:DinB family protein [Flavobacterium arcticum]AXG73914.1 DinB family protein [Flavobacterium arcticum]KAF2508891.1 DinB family protein [Flavobacterium arcticum]